MFEHTGRSQEGAERREAGPEPGSARREGLPVREARGSKIEHLTRLAPTVFVVCLLAATAVAFAATEHLKLEDSPIRSTRITTLFSPVCDACPPGARSALIGFRLRREEDVRLDIVDSSGGMVREALASQIVPGRVFREFAWDGRDASGQVVADGVYQAQITLRDEGRTIVFPDEIQVDATPPEVDDIKVKRAVFSPDGDGRADRTSLLYRFSEPAYAVLYVDGNALPHGYRKRPVGSYQWYGKGVAARNAPPRARRPGSRRQSRPLDSRAPRPHPLRRAAPTALPGLRWTAAAHPRLDRREDASLGARRAGRTELGPGARCRAPCAPSRCGFRGPRAATGSR